MAGPTGYQRLMRKAGGRQVAGTPKNEYMQGKYLRRNDRPLTVKAGKAMKVGLQAPGIKRATTTYGKVRKVIRGAD